MAGTEKAGLRAYQEQLLAGAAGDVLEIGGGTGANLPCYSPAITSLTIGPEVRRASHRGQRHGTRGQGRLHPGRRNQPGSPRSDRVPRPADRTSSPVAGRNRGLVGIAAVLDLLADTTGSRPTADRQRSLAR